MAYALFLHDNRQLSAAYLARFNRYDWIILAFLQYCAPTKKVETWLGQFVVGNSLDEILPYPRAYFSQDY